MQQSLILIGTQSIRLFEVCFIYLKHYLVSWHLRTRVHFLARHEIRTKTTLLQFPKETNTRGSKTDFTPFHTNLQSFD